MPTSDQEQETVTEKPKRRVQRYHLKVPARDTRDRASTVS